MKHRIVPLVAAFAAAVGLVPTATAQAYDSYDTTIATAQSSGITGTESAVVINDDGLPVMAVLNDTDNTISVVARLDSACDQSEQSTIASGIASADIDIALAPNGTPVVAYHDTSNRLWLVDCPSTCMAPSYVTRNSGAGTLGLSINGHDDEAHVSYFQRGQSDLGLVHVFRLTNPFRGRGF